MSPPEVQDTAAAELAAYYARRAAEYDRVYARPERQASLSGMCEWVAQAFEGRHGLELACGTGWWTRFAARAAASWTATDVNEPVLEIARSRPGMPERVSWRHADVWALDSLPPGPVHGRWDALLAAFWWSHVPRSRLAGWLRTLHARLAPGARVVFIDNLFVPGSSTPISHTGPQGDTWQTRTLDDGSTHQVLKNFPTRDEALSLLGSETTSHEWITCQYFWILDYRLRR